MLRLSITTSWLVLAGLASAGFNSTGEPLFMNGFQQRAEWGECFELKGLMDRTCQEEIISFDRPHYNLFTFGDKPREKAIG
ncbi:uncharacterized protein N7496_006719 [Penicillium cataractarum]|uniref:Uncharacterized protein n=1 Tax=Penicillium cataractarum TaxID=2100454 RepID=A0A9W9S217_9EURO|nr:uncharacterized protein N7496_006719 [Penicillium cataractarum]KAJ5370627.1 hypothetical protein N7496_006719 [Penicillium cataractarum]